LVGKVLIDFEYIELALKLYIAETYATISSRLEGIVTFKYGWEDVENEPLDRLLNQFSKISSDHQLVKGLGLLQKERNKLAHQAYVLTLEEQSDRDHLEKEYARITKPKSKTKALVVRTMEACKVLESPFSKTTRKSGNT